MGIKLVLVQVHVSTLVPGYMGSDCLSGHAIKTHCLDDGFSCVTSYLTQFHRSASSTLLYVLLVARSVKVSPYGSTIGL